MMRGVSSRVCEEQEREGLPEEAVPGQWAFTWFSCLVKVRMSAVGAGLLHRGYAPALFLAFTPAMEGAQNISLGNSFIVITWDSRTSRWLSRAAPKCSQRCVSSAAHFLDFHAYFWLEPELGCSQQSRSGFFGRERSLLFSLLCPTFWVQGSWPLWL